MNKGRQESGGPPVDAAAPHQQSESGRPNEDSDDPITRLAKWYSSCCDGEWEHGFGISISTIDNPGFIIKIDLSGTPLEGASLPSVEWESPSDPAGDWFQWHLCEGASEWEGVCSPNHLRRVIEGFLDSVERG